MELNWALFLQINNIRGKIMKLKIISITVITGIVLLSSINSFAQDSSKSILSKNIYALQFQVRGLLDVNSFEGSVLSAKYNFNEKNSIRFGISFNGNSTNTEIQVFYDDSVTNEERKGDSYSIELNLQYLRNHFINDELFLYYGLGPEIYLSNYNTVLDQYERRFNLGIDFVTGVEWFVYKSLSVSGEYGFKLYYSRTKQKRIDNDNRENRITSNSFLVNANPVKIGLSIYF